MKHLNLHFIIETRKLLFKQSYVGRNQFSWNEEFNKSYGKKDNKQSNDPYYLYL